MRPRSLQSKNVRIVEIVYEKPIWFDMTLPETFPFAGEQVCSIFDRKRFVVHQKREYGIKLRCRCGPFHHAFVVFLEGVAIFDAPHSLAL